MTDPESEIKALYHQIQLINEQLSTQTEQIRNLQKDVETMKTTLQHLTEGQDQEAEENSPIEALFEKLQNIERKLNKLTSGR